MPAAHILRRSDVLIILYIKHDRNRLTGTVLTNIGNSAEIVRHKSLCKVRYQKYSKVRTNNF
jgi:hypothetical protein